MDGDHDAQHTDAGIRALSDLLDRPKQIICSFEREVGRLNRKSGAPRPQALTLSGPSADGQSMTTSVVTSQLVILS